MARTPRRAGGSRHSFEPLGAASVIGSAASRESSIARAEASREGCWGPASRAHFRHRGRTSGVASARSEGRGAPHACHRRHVPDRPAAPQPHPRPAVDREAPAAARRVRLGQTEHAPPPGDRGREPLLAERAVPQRRAGVRPRCGAPGGRLPGPQGGLRGQLPPAPAARRPARPPQRHQEVVLTPSCRLLATWSGTRTRGPLDQERPANVRVASGLGMRLVASSPLGRVSVLCESGPR